MDPETLQVTVMLGARIDNGDPFDDETLKLQRRRLDQIGEGFRRAHETPPADLPASLDALMQRLGDC